ncbi:MAG: pilus assembly protein PilB [Lentisphaerae bacterium RIFOXYB12_FULL_60_10]|nr:MAG: pilus assembly protein PilB [Lentisphaerae bacterium RIFOXYB12_FULL_60_10]
MAETNSLQDPLLLLLVERKALTAEQAQQVLDEHQQGGRPVRTLVIDMGMIEEDPLIQHIAEFLGTEVINLPATDIPPDVIRSVPASVARMYNVVPVEVGGTTVRLATSNLVNPQVSDELMFVLTSDVTFVLAREEDIKNCINQFYGDESNAVSEMLSTLEAEIGEAGDRLGGAAEGDEKSIEEAAGSTPVIKFVNLVMYQAINDKASDIHFEPFEKEFKIRYRVDGALYEMTPPPKRLGAPIISRVKVMAGLNIAERRIPQDGRIQITIGGRVIDLRVSTLPTQFGESVVLRVLDRSVVSLALENLGIPDDVFDSFTLDVEKPNGIIIVTGPTGSGKTTTLYSALRRINTVDRKLLTAEEPVEYDIEGIIQVPISEVSGNTFPLVLRAFMRQDPDVMMVGEIRDLETAQIAIQASLTGHLVFSTLHTNDAAGAVTRLIDMDVEPYLISSTLEAVVGQRLVRVICEACKTAVDPDEESLRLLGLNARDVEGRKFYRGSGCPKCSEKGYKGRKGIYEYLSMSNPVRELIDQRQPTLVIREKAIQLGMRTLREDGIRNILDGYTTVDEVIKYT